VCACPDAETVTVSVCVCVSVRLPRRPRPNLEAVLHMKAVVEHNDAAGSLGRRLRVVCQTLVRQHHPAPMKHAKPVATLRLGRLL
jgi:hypothetical protein